MSDAPRTVRVRALCRVLPDGKFAVYGYTLLEGEKPEDEFWEVVNNTCGAECGREFILTADVPLPDAAVPEIEATVEETADDEDQASHQCCIHCGDYVGGCRCDGGIS